MNRSDRIREFRNAIIEAEADEVEAMFGNFLSKVTDEEQMRDTHYILGISLDEEGVIEDYGYAKYTTSSDVQVIESSVAFDDSDLLVYLPADASIHPETLRGAIISELSRDFTEDKLIEHGIKT